MELREPFPEHVPMPKPSFVSDGGRKKKIVRTMVEEFASSEEEVNAVDEDNSEADYVNSDHRDSSNGDDVVLGYEDIREIVVVDETRATPPAMERCSKPLQDPTHTSKVGKADAKPFLKRKVRSIVGRKRERNLLEVDS